MYIGSRSKTNKVNEQRGTYFNITDNICKRGYTFKTDRNLKL